MRVRFARLSFFFFFKVMNEIGCVEGWVFLGAGRKLAWRVTFFSLFMDKIEYCIGFGT